MIIEVTVRQQLPDQTIALNVYHYEVGAEDDPLFWEQASLDFATQMTLQYINVAVEMSDAVAFLGGDIFLMAEDLKTKVLKASYNMSLVGSVIDDMASNFVTGTVYGKRSMGGRSARKSISGFTERDKNTNQWNAAILNGLALFAARWVNEFIGLDSEETYQPVYVSRTHGFFDLLTGLVELNTNVGSMNTRKAGRGM